MLISDPLRRAQIAQGDASVDPEKCPNCGSARYGSYCSTCGQKNQPLRQPLRRFAQEALTEYVGMDGRLWKTLGYLLFKSGRLTVEYLEGRRTMFLRPLRIYLSATILFFFLLSVLDPAERVRQAVDNRVSVGDTMMTVEQRLARISELLADDAGRLATQLDLVDSLSSRLDSFRAAFATDTLIQSIPDSLLRNQEEEFAAISDDLADERGETAALRSKNENRRERFEWQTSVLNGYPADSSINPSDLRDEAEIRFPDNSSILVNSEADTGIPDWIPQGQAFRRLDEAQTPEEEADALAGFVRSAIEKIPVVMFFLLPVFALLLKVIYIRRDWLFVEHFVLGLHTHAFSFLVFAIIILSYWMSGAAPWASVVGNILAISIPVYFYLAIKKVYGQGWIKTAIKMGLLSTLYVFIVAMGVVLALVLATTMG